MHSVRGAQRLSSRPLTGVAGRARAAATRRDACTRCDGHRTLHRTNDAAPGASDPSREWRDAHARRRRDATRTHSARRGENGAKETLLRIEQRPPADAIESSVHNIAALVLAQAGRVVLLVKGAVRTGPVVFEAVHAQETLHHTLL